MGRSTLPSRTARRMSLARKTFAAGAGRPRTDAARCPCGAMTLKRARARGRTGEHGPSCSFYRGRATLKVLRARKTTP